MKTIVLAALGATLLAGFAVDGAAAAQRYQSRGPVVQPPPRSDEGFRNSYNAYGFSYDRPDARVYGGAISAPAGR